MNKTLIILIGPKGTGKSFIGKTIEENLNIRFLRVEPIWIDYLKNKDKTIEGWQLVNQAIEHEFKNHDTLVVESLGMGDPFKQTIKFFQKIVEIKLVKISTDLGECLNRVKSRDKREHISLSDDRVNEYNKLAVKVKHDWDLIIDNNGPATKQEILSSINSII